MWFKYGLKAQKLLAQGNALGIIAANKAPCKGKSFVYGLVFKSFCPYRSASVLTQLPKALPWARSFWAFSPYLNHMQNFSQFIRAPSAELMP